MNNYMKTIISGLKQWVSSQKSDWNQSDDSAANYVKNRTHYTDVKKTIILNETTLNEVNTSLEVSNALKNNQKYIVKFNNSEYECISYVIEDNVIGIGNTLAISGEDTGLPFTIITVNLSSNMVGMSIVVYDGLHTTLPCTVSVVEVQEVVKKLDEKYLPDSVALKEDIPESFSTSWNDLTDKPFGEIAAMGDTLIWDGNTEGLESVDVGGEMTYRISSSVPSIEDCVNGTISVYSDGSSSVLSYEQIQEIATDFGNTGAFLLVNGIIVIPHDDFTIDLDIGTLTTFPKAGVWHADLGTGNYIASLTIPGYNGFVSEQTTIKTIDPKYLPLYNGEVAK